ncbi:MAG: cytochrome P450 [Solirubrobacterales bacterium]
MPVETPSKTVAAEASEAPIKGFPDGPRMPMTIQSVGFMLRHVPMMRRARAKYGDMFHARLIGFPDFVVISNPDLIKQVLTEKPTVLHAGTGSPLGAVLGANSLLAIDEDIHLRQRRLLLPPFHGERMQSYPEDFKRIADDVMDTWQTGVPIRTLESMQLITLRAILQTIFGAHGSTLDELEVRMPEFVEAGMRVIMIRFAHKDLGPRSPWGNFVRQRDACDKLLFGLIDEARNDPKIEERSDVMSLLVQATDEDGTPMTNQEIRDQLLTMLVAGHETTAGTLAWTVERLTRNPRVLEKVTESVRAGETEYLGAVFDETLRIRPTVSFAVRSVQVESYELGGYELPYNTRIASAPTLTHDDPNLFENPREFRPERFLEERPSNYAYIPFGGGLRRCIGAAFARMEYMAVMERMLDRFDIEPTDEKFEPWQFRSVTFAPGNGGMATFTPRS